MHIKLLLRNVNSLAGEEIQVAQKENIEYKGNVVKAKLLIIIALFVG